MILELCPFFLNKQIISDSKKYWDHRLDPSERLVQVAVRLM